MPGMIEYWGCLILLSEIARLSLAQLPEISFLVFVLINIEAFQQTLGRPGDLTQQTI